MGRSFSFARTASTGARGYDEAPASKTSNTVASARHSLVLCYFFGCSNRTRIHFRAQIIIGLDSSLRRRRRPSCTTFSSFHQKVENNFIYARFWEEVMHMAKHQKGEMGQIELVFSVIVLVFCGFFLMFAYGIEKVVRWAKDILSDYPEQNRLAMVFVAVFALLVVAGKWLDFF